jgi:hypothetical protein
MERTAYNLLREGMDAASVKATIRARYGVKNARWIQSAINQGDGARGRRVNPPGVDVRRSAVIFDVKEDNENR